MNNQNTSVGLIIIIAIVAIVLLIYLRRKFKRLVLPNVFLITGAVKSGKTLLSVHLAIKTYKRNLRHYKMFGVIANAIKYVTRGKFFAHYVDEEPMLYSNIHLANVKYNILTLDVIRCKVRIPRKSVVLIDEYSLLADSMLYNDQKINNDLMVFTKLFAHITHGGTCIFDTQSPSDLHFTAKRCISSYLYIYERKKYPFISILKVREMMYDDSKSTINVIDEDLELNMRKIIILNSTYKKYDCYCYSTITDKKVCYVDYDVFIKDKNDDLKNYEIVTLQPFGREINEYLKITYPKEINLDDKEEGTNDENKQED